MASQPTPTQGTVTYDASGALTLTNQAQKALANAQDFAIDSADMAEIAGEDLRQVKALQKDVEAARTSITGPLNQAVKAVNDLFRAPKEYLEKAENTLKRALVAWNTEQERLAAIARRQAEEAARAERERLAQIEAAQQEAARLAQEAARKAAEEAAAAALAGDEEAQARAQAEAQAQAEAAQAAQSEADMAAQVAQIVTIPAAVPAPAKVAGISGRVTYSAEVTDLMALIQAVAAGNAPIECLVADTKFLGAQARAFKRAGPLYPGVTAVAERGIAARSA